MGIVKLQAIFSGPAALSAMAVALAIGMAACGGGGSSVSGGTSCPQQYGGGGGSGSGSGAANCTPAASPTPAPTAAAAVGILLTGESPVTTVSDGTVLGYFLGTVISMPSGSGAVTLTAGTTVKFMNLESGGGLPHTASFLGAYSGSYPATFTNTNGFITASAAGTVISSPNFSTGSINPGSSSAAYNAGGPGMFVFGCAYHYLTNNMRTVIIVM